MKKLIKSSTVAAILISLGVYGLLNSNYSYFAMLLFAFGLFTICFYKLDLFTGKCGYTYRIWPLKSVSLKDILIILLVNLVVGYLVGLLFSTTSNEVVTVATKVVSSWTFTFGYFVRACFCGAIMFLTVHTYKNGSPLGVFFGVPLFIICGFQHCIANIIIMGVARAVSAPLLLAIIGNWIGAAIMNRLVEDTTTNVKEEAFNEEVGGK